MLSFSRTAVHAFLPCQSQGDLKFSLYNPYEIHLLPGQRVTIDFLIAIKLPAGFQTDIHIDPCAAPKCNLYAKTLCESNSHNSPNSPHGHLSPLSFLALQLELEPVHRAWLPPFTTTTTS
jgi:hypothetical protein